MALAIALSLLVVGGGVMAAKAMLFGGSACDESLVRRVPAPPETAPPETVVRSYLDAVMAHDKATVRELTVPSFYDHEQSTHPSAFCVWKSISALEIAPAYPDTYERGGYRRVVNVLVDFVVKSRDPAAFHDGRRPWGYLLVRNSSAERWKIIDEGLG
jgi:hypothetical protein